MDPLQPIGKAVLQLRLAETELVHDPSEERLLRRRHHPVGGQHLGHHERPRHTIIHGAEATEIRARRLR